VTLNGKRSILPQHGGSKEIGKGLWQAILKQLGIKE
jgi:mRNA interferase HicA